MADNKTPLVLHVTERCNSNCRMCSVRGVQNKAEEHDRDLEEVFRTLEENSGDYVTVDFTGGEPTVNEQLPEMIEKAKELGYRRVSISTNGRKLADRDYFNELVTKGLDHATVALHSVDEETSERITGHAENFEQTVKGIENLASSPETTVSIGTVPMKPNINRLDEMAEILLEAGVSKWNITELKPEGPQGSYGELSIPPDTLSEKLGEMEQLLSSFRDVSFYNFTRCELPEEIRENHGLITVFDKSSWKFDKGGKDWNKNESRHEKKEKTRICENCRYSNRCFGFWKKDLELYREETVSTARENLAL